MSVEKLSIKTGLPKETIRFMKENGFLVPPYRPEMPKSEKKTVGPSTPASELKFLKNKWKNLILDLKPDSSDAYEKASSLTYLIMARFSFDEIAKMLSDPSLIPVTVEIHIKGESKVHPNLCAILRGLDFTQISDAFRLGEEIGRNLKLPAKMLPHVSDIKKKCGEISSFLGTDTPPLISSNLALILAIVFISGAPLALIARFNVWLAVGSFCIGILFAIVRSGLLNYADDNVEAAEKLSAALTKTLAGFELNVDLCSLKLPSYFENNYLNYGSPAAAASDYIDEISSKGEVYSERARSVSALLNKISFV